MEINQSEHELVYRQYHSNYLVSDTLYVFASKLNAKDQVVYKLYAISVKSNGLPKKLIEQTVSMARYKEVIQEMTEELRKTLPEVEFVEENDGHLAIAGVPGAEHTRVLSGRAAVEAFKFAQSIKNESGVMEITSKEQALGAIDALKGLLSSLGDGVPEGLEAAVSSLDQGAALLEKLDRKKEELENKKKDLELKKEEKADSPSEKTEDKPDSDSNRLSKFMK